MIIKKWFSHRILISQRPDASDGRKEVLGWRYTSWLLYSLFSIVFSNIIFASSSESWSFIVHLLQLFFGYMIRLKTDVDFKNISFVILSTISGTITVIGRWKIGPRERFEGS